METVLFREHKASFGPYLRALRVGRGLSLRDAATELGVSLAKLQKMETGGRFRIESPAIFDSMAALFERPVAEVLAAAGVRFDVPRSAAAEPDAPLPPPAFALYRKPPAAPTPAPPAQEEQKPPSPPPSQPSNAVPP